MEYLQMGINLAPVIIAVASAVAAITPTPKDNRALKWIKRFFNVLALNVGQARPAGDVIAEQNRGIK